MHDNSYGGFAEYFDRLNGDARYKKRTEYMLSIFEKYGRKPKLLLDLACGTGEFALNFSKKGCEVIAVDCSYEMLSVARDKAQKQKQDILFLCQRAEELDLYGTVDGAVCCFDSINHIDDEKTLEKAIQKVALYLEKDCLFIFDVNTPYRHKNVLGGKTLLYDEPDLYFVWRNEYIEKHDALHITLDIFTPDGDRYNRTVQDIYERAYSTKELKKMIEKAGLSLVAVYDDLSFNPASDTSERLYYVTKKV